MPENKTIIIMQSTLILTFMLMIGWLVGRSFGQYGAAINPLHFWYDDIKTERERLTLVDYRIVTVNTEIISIVCCVVLCMLDCCPWQQQTHTKKNFISRDQAIYLSPYEFLRRLLHCHHHIYTYSIVFYSSSSMYICVHLPPLIKPTHFHSLIMPSRKIVSLLIIDH